MGSGMDRYWAKAKRILMGNVSHETVVFVFFLFIASGFWLLQTLNETFEVELKIPLRLTGVPDRVVLTTELPEYLKVQVRDKGTTLIKYYKKSQLPTVEVDFGKYDNGTGGHVQLYGTEIIHSLQDVMDPATQILSVRPDTIEYFYNRGLSRRLPVQVCGTVATSPQNYLQEVRTAPDSVTVYASSAVLDTMTYAYTQPVEFTELSENTSAPVRMRQIKGVKYEPATVRMTASVGYYTEKTLAIPVMGLNFPADKSLKTFPSTVEVTFRVESSRYQSTLPEDFVLAITYEELLQNEGDKYRLHLKSLPEGVSNVRIHPIEVDYLIEHKDSEDQQQ